MNAQSKNTMLRNLTGLFRGTLQKCFLCSPGCHNSTTLKLCKNPFTQYIPAIFAFFCVTDILANVNELGS